MSGDANPSSINTSSIDDRIESIGLKIKPDLRNTLQSDLGLNDQQLDSWLMMGETGYQPVPADIDITNKETLNALEKSGQLSQVAKELVAIQAPVAMVSEVSNPANWQKDQYIGPGAMAVSTFIQPAPQAYTLPLPDLDPPLDPSTISLDALVMSILTRRAEIIEVQLREQISSIQAKNDELAVANDWLTKAKDKKADAGTSGNTTFGDDFKAYWDSLGAEYQDSDRSGDAGTQHNSADWDVNIEGLKGKIEALTSQSQLETTKLQQTINKYNQSFEMLSNFINKYYQSVNTIIQNLR